MATDFLANGMNDFYIHKTAESEDGFNYYGYARRDGRVLIMREEISTNDILYAVSGYNLTSAWTNRASLSYDEINKI